MKGSMCLLLTIAMVVVACSDSGDTTGGGGAGTTFDTGTLVVGVTSEFLAGPDLTRLDAEMMVDNVVISDASTQLGGSGDGFPAELTFDDVAGGARLAITLRGYDPFDELRVVRHMETEAVAGATQLARLRLQTLCRLTTMEELQQGASPGAPSCDEIARTCIAGQCADAYMPPSEQQTYSPDWAGVIDCKPAGGGAPEVILGHGPSFIAAQDYELAEIEAGNQGGHHLWFAARLRNLDHRDARITVGAEIPDLAVSIGPFDSVQSLVDDGSEYCKLPGIFLRVDGDVDISALLGLEMRVFFSIEDADGDLASDELWVTMSTYTI
jgi:hypothetical protein